MPKSLLNKKGRAWLIVLAVMVIYFAVGLWLGLQEKEDGAWFSPDALWVLVTSAPFSFLFGIFAYKMTGQVVLPPVIYAGAWVAYEIFVGLQSGSSFPSSLKDGMIFGVLFSLICLATSGFTKWFSLHKKGRWLLAMMAGYLLTIGVLMVQCDRSGTMTALLMVVLPAAIFHAVYGVVSYKLVRRILFPALLLLCFVAPLWFFFGIAWDPAFYVGVAVWLVAPAASFITRLISRKTEQPDAILQPTQDVPAEKRPITPKVIRSFIFWLLLMAIPAVVRLCALIPYWFEAGWYFPNDGDYGQLILYTLFTPIRNYLSLIWTGALAILTIARPHLSRAPRAHRVLKWVAAVAGGLFAVLTVAMFAVYSENTFSPTAWISQSTTLAMIGLAIAALLLQDKHHKVTGILAIVYTALSCSNALYWDIAPLLSNGTWEVLLSARYLIDTLLTHYCSGCIALFALYPLKKREQNQENASSL